MEASKMLEVDFHWIPWSGEESKSNGFSSLWLIAQATFVEEAKMADDRVLLEISIALAETLRDKFPEITSPRDSQIGAILQYVLCEDVFAVLPTGMEKSLIYQVIPRHMSLSELSNDNYEYTIKSFECFIYYMC